MPVTPDVELAIDELRATFDGKDITFSETGDGGAWVRIEGLELNGPFEQADSWVAFQITFQYPAADVYPHFVRADLARRDGQPLGQAFQQVNWGPSAVPGVQVSRATRQIDPTIDTAALKLLKVIQFMEAS